MTCQQLARLSDKRLLSRIQKLADVERRVTISILLHINEIERRRLHLKLGYGSLFDYCAEHLGYSAPAAGRRIQSARCVRDYPRVQQMLERNEINLTTISMIAGMMTKKNCGDLLRRIRGKSTREVEAIKAEFYGPVKIQDRIKPVYEAIRQETPVAAMPSESTLGAESESNTGTTDEQGKLTAITTNTRPAVTIQKRLRIEFSAKQEFIEKFEEVRGLLMHKFAGRPSFEQVFDVVLDLFLDRNCPVLRQKRREERASKTAIAAANKKQTKATRLAQHKTSHSRRREWNQRRPIPAAVRDAVYTKSNGRCAYVGTDGRRCNSTVCVQVDHVVPVARGGTNDPSNLRILCASHNRLEAERVLGAT